MGVLGCPFKLFGRLMVSCFKVTGYTVTFVIQILWYVFHRQTHDIGLAFGDFGRSVVGALGDIFRD